MRFPCFALRDKKHGLSTPEVNRLIDTLHQLYETGILSPQQLQPNNQHYTNSGSSGGEQEEMEGKDINCYVIDLWYVYCGEFICLFVVMFRAKMAA